MMYDVAKNSGLLVSVTEDLVIVASDADVTRQLERPKCCSIWIDYRD